MEKKSKIQERYDLIKKGEHTGSSNKRRRTSRIFLIVDIILIVLILLYISRPDTETMYNSTSLQVGNAAYRFSLLQDREEGNLVATISVNAVDKTVLTQGPPLGTVDITCDDTRWYSGEIGENISTLTLEKGQSRSFTRDLPVPYLQSYAKKNPTVVISEKERLFSPSREFVPLKAVFTINAAEKVSASIDFNLEVD